MMVARVKEGGEGRGDDGVYLGKIRVFQDRLTILQFEN